MKNQGIRFPLLLLIILCYAMSSCVSTSNTLAKRGIEKRKYTKGYYLNLITRHTHQNNIASLKSLLAEPADPQHVGQLTIDNPGKKSRLLKVTPKRFKKLLKQIRSLPDSIICGDEITFRTGEKEQVKVISVGVEEITYKKCSNLSGPDYVVKRSSIFMIEYGNGTKELFKAEKEGKAKEEEYYYTNESPQETTVELEETDSFAVASLVFGILSLLLFGLGGALLGIPGIVLGRKGKDRIAHSKGKLSGRGMARAGIVMSIISISLTILIIVIIVTLVF